MSKAERYWSHGKASATLTDILYGLLIDNAHANTTLDEGECCSEAHRPCSNL